METNNIEFLELTIHNAYHFKGRYVIPLDKLGLTNVRGENYDTSEMSSNGAGKSQIEFCLRRLLYGKKAAKYETVNEAVNEDNFLLGLKLRNRKHGAVYEIYESRKHADFKKDGLHCFVTKNNKRVPFGLKNSGESLRSDFVTAALGMTYDEFVGSILITQGSSHVLLNGSQQERVEFISKFFGLGIFDDMYTKFKQDLKDAKARLDDCRGIEVQYKAVETGLLDEKTLEHYRAVLVKLRNKISRLKKSRRELQDAQSKYLEVKSAYKAFCRYRESIEEITSENSDIDFSDASSKLARLESKLDDLTQRIAKISANEKAIENSRIAKRRRKNIVASLPEKYVGRSASDIKSVIAKKTARENELTAKLRTMASQRDIIDTIAVNMQQLEQIEMLDADYDECKEEQTKCETLEAELTEKIERCLARIDVKEDIDVSMSHCPTCGSHIDAKKVEIEIEKLRAEMLAFEKERKKAHRTAQKCKLFCDTKDLVKKHKIDVNVTPQLMEELALEIKNIRERVEELEGVHEKLSDIEKLDAQLSVITVHDDDDTDVESLAKIQTKVKRKVAVLRRYVNLIESAPKRVKKPEGVDFEDKLSTVESKLDSNVRKAEKVKLQLDAHEDAVKALKEMRPEIDKLRELEINVRVLTGLCLAYGKRGLKTRKIQAIISAIKERLPTWIALMFTQRGFRVDTYGSETKLGFIVVQQYKDSKGKIRERRYDIRRLSGGERTRMMVALILTIIDIVPEDKRSNLLFLDEPEAGLDAVNRALLSDLLIPALQKRKPSLMLIAHALDVPKRSFNTEIVVTRRNSQASIAVKRKEGSK